MLLWCCQCVRRRGIAIAQPCVSFVVFWCNSFAFPLNLLNFKLKLQFPGYNNKFHIALFLCHNTKVLLYASSRATWTTRPTGQTGETWQEGRPWRKGWSGKYLICRPTCLLHDCCSAGEYSSVYGIYFSFSHDRASMV